jgi:hypothetical protein
LASRHRIVVTWFAAVALGVAGACNLAAERGPAPAPITFESPTPSPTATPTPEAESNFPASDAATQAANEAEQKAQQAAKKASEAATAANEASSAARDAARAAAKAAAASKNRPGIAASKKPTATGRPIATPATSSIGTPEASPAAAVESRPENPNASKAVDQLADRIKSIDRTRLSAADAQRYDVAVGLLASARKSLSRNENMAVFSLVDKAKVLLQGIEQ